ncbi:hypothetical protein HU675_0042540 [Bradyrhizobium septentrionale]|uniref:hypothetical protein n=1 Tax=Bradyrhizobium septentrionale TaxID=1404411 RepID=UPI0014086322|nr:hypothetical protein [Bradyrhizobium septentrionale]UGY24518.1 hypothetical protein HU675_0042540 [Bradyrhizobium septentrionale]
MGNPGGLKDVEFFLPFGGSILKLAASAFHSPPVIRRHELPVGQLSKICQSPRAKIFRFIVMTTQCMVCPSHPIEGRVAIVTNAV